MNINFKIYNINNNTYQLINNCDYSNFTIKKTKENYFQEIIEFSGTLKFFADDFDLIKSIFDAGQNAEIIVIQNGNEYSCKVDFSGANFDIEKKIVEIKLIYQNHYKDLISKKDIKVNVISGLAKKEIIIDKHTGLTFATEIEDFIADGDQTYTMPTYGNGKPKTITSTHTILQATLSYRKVGGVGCEDLGGGTYRHYLRWTLQTVYNSGTGEPLEFEQNFSNDGQIITCTDTSPSSTVNYKTYTNNLKSQIEEQYFTYHRGYSFFDIIENLIQNLDNTILFEVSGGTTDSFYFLKNYTDKTSTTGGGNSNKPFIAMYLLTITDAILEDDLSERDFAATKGYLTLKELTDFLKSIGIFWYLEKRGTDYYFMTKHYSELQQSTQAISLNSYLGFDFSRLAMNYTVESPEFRKIINKNIGNTSKDFTAQYIDYLNLIEKDLEQENQTFFTDISDIMTRGKAIYDDNSNGKFTVLACLQSNNQIYVRAATSDFSTININNQEFSFSYLKRKIFAPGPNSKAEIEGQTISLPTDNLEKRKSIQLQVNCNNIDDFDISKDIQFQDKKVEIQEIIINPKENSANLKLKL